MPCLAVARVRLVVDVHRKVVKDCDGHAINERVRRRRRSPLARLDKEVAHPFLRARRAAMVECERVVVLARNVVDLAEDAHGGGQHRDHVLILRATDVEEDSIDHPLARQHQVLRDGGLVGELGLEDGDELGILLAQQCNRRGVVAGVQALRQSPPVAVHLHVEAPGVLERRDECLLLHGERLDLRAQVRQLDALVVLGLSRAAGAPLAVREPFAHSVRGRLLRTTGRS